MLYTVSTSRDLNLTLVDSFVRKFDLPLLYSIIVFREVLSCKSPIGRFFGAYCRILPKQGHTQSRLQQIFEILIDR